MSAPARVTIRRRGERGRPRRVLLVSMPMAAASRPSIQLGLLAAIGRRAGHQVDTCHASVDFAVAVNEALRAIDGERERRTDPYAALTDVRGPLIGEWLFSEAAFGDDAPDREGGALETWRDCGGEQYASVEALRHLRDHVVPAFLAVALSSIDWSVYDVVGFSTTFEQNCASIALARLVKQQHPSILTVFGGANVESTMGIELLTHVPAIDFVVRGEADLTFPALLDALSCGDDPLQVEGVSGRHEGCIVVNDPSTPVDDLDALPVPVYDEYLERFRRSGLAEAGGRLELPYESARGCWWGAKRHCTFCGLNGSTMRYRSKRHDKVLAELDTLARRYKTSRFFAVDNIIDRSYFETLLERLRDYDFDLFYEVKADLTADQIRQLADAGVRRIQPGIESLSSHILGLMRKGTRASWNVNVLRWCRVHRIDPAWNLLWGFPGELQSDVDEQVALLPLLHHLTPPRHEGTVWLERFSPLTVETERFALRDLRPNPAYATVYPDRFDLGALAYFFEAEVEGTLDPAAFAGLVDAAAAWRSAAAAGASLTVFRGPSFLRIEDERTPGRRETHHLEGPSAAVYAACLRSPRKADDVSGELGAPSSLVGAALDAFSDAGLMMRDGNLYLSLAIPPSDR